MGRKKAWQLWGSHVFLVVPSADGECTVVMTGSVGEETLTLPTALSQQVGQVHNTHVKLCPTASFSKKLNTTKCSEVAGRAAPTSVS